MNLLEIWVRLDVPALAPGEHVLARHITGWCSEIPRDLNSVPEYKWEGTAALSAAGKTLPGKANKTVNEHLPPRVLIFCMTRHATSRVALCHAKVKP